MDTKPDSDSAVDSAPPAPASPAPAAAPPSPEQLREMVMADRMARAKACEADLADVLRRHGCALVPAVQTVELDALDGTFGLRATFRIVPR